jgi:hypothetical protein
MIVETTLIRHLYGKEPLLSLILTFAPVPFSPPRFLAGFVEYGPGLRRAKQVDPVRRALRRPCARSGRGGDGGDDRALPAEIDDMQIAAISAAGRSIPKVYSPGGVT